MERTKLIVKDCLACSCEVDPNRWDESVLALTGTLPPYPGLTNQVELADGVAADFHRRLEEARRGCT